VLHSFETSSVWLGGVSVWLGWVQCVAGTGSGALKEKKDFDVKKCTCIVERILKRSCSNETYVNSILQ
jgi:hypothetical protein